MDNALIKFKDYLMTPATRGSSSPPVGIKAKDLDDNFKRTTIIDSKTSLYKPAHSQDGTELIFASGDKTASWIEIEVCVDGATKKMMVLGTDPY